MELARFTYRELEDVRDRLFESVLGLDGVTLLDLDERANRVRVGVERPIAAAGVRRIVSDLGVPDEMVVVEVLPPAEPAVGLPLFSSLCNGQSTEGTICEHFRPVNGGNITRFGDSETVGACTHGFAAVHDVLGVFMIGNSHCSLATYAWDGNTLFEPWPDSVGYEQYDEPGFLIGPDQARFSDANLQKITATTFNGTISRTLQRKNNGVVVDGGFIIDVNDPEFQILNLRQKAFSGEALDKVGIATGWQFGFVDETCSDRNGTDGVWRLCSQGIEARSDPGDSGSPAFIFDGTSSVVVVGIVWGKGGSLKTWISPIEGLEDDYGGTFSWTGLGS